MGGLMDFWLAFWAGTQLSWQFLQDIGAVNFLGAIGVILAAGLVPSGLIVLFFSWSTCAAEA